MTLKEAAQTLCALLQGCHTVDVELMAAQWGNPTAYLKTGDHLHQVRISTPS